MVDRYLLAVQHKGVINKNIGRGLGLCKCRTVSTEKQRRVGWCM